jgi:hypothetical protein
MNRKIRKKEGTAAIFFFISFSDHKDKKTQELIREMNEKNMKAAVRKFLHFLVSPGP